jgi:hypothetical protein
MPATAKRITGKAAMVAVLKRAKRPLPAKEIITRALKTKGVALAGKTPEATLSAILATENKKGGIFERTEPGIYRLRERAKAGFGEILVEFSESKPRRPST